MLRRASDFLSWPRIAPAGAAVHLPPMRRILLSATLLLGAPSVRVFASDAAPHVVDPAPVLGSASPAAAALEQKLTRFEHASGLRVLVHFHPKSPPEAEDKIPGAYMRSLATKLGTDATGVLAVYFADEDDWRLWIGDNLTAKFAGQSGTAAELTANHAIHDAKEALFAAARPQAAATLAKTKTAASPPPTPAVRIALEADAIVDALITKLSPQ